MFRRGSDGGGGGGGDGGDSKKLSTLINQVQSLQNAEKNYSEMQLDEMIVYAEILGSIANTLKRQRKPVEAAVRASEAALMAKKAKRMLEECARKPHSPIRPRPPAHGVSCLARECESRRRAGGGPAEGGGCEGGTGDAGGRFLRGHERERSGRV